MKTLKPDFKLRQSINQIEPSRFKSKKKNQPWEEKQSWYKSENGQDQTEKEDLSQQREKNRGTDQVSKV